MRAGKLKALGTTGKTRSSVLPDVPTIAEAGVPGYETGIWLGLMAPAGTPRPVLERLNAEIAKVLNAAGRQGKLEQAGRRADEHDASSSSTSSCATTSPSGPAWSRQPE